MKNNELRKRLEAEGVKPREIKPAVYGGFRGLVESSFAHLSEEERHIETVVMCLTHPDSPHVEQSKTEVMIETAPANFSDKAIVKWLRIIAILLGILIALVCVDQARAAGGTSQIDVIKVTDGVTTLTAAAPFKISFSGCSVSGTGSAWAINCTGGAANPGGSAHQLQVNLNGTGFAGIAAGTAGQVLCSNGTTNDPAMCDPVVSGPDAPGVAPTKPPVQVGLFDGTNVQRVLGSAAGRLSVDVNSAPTTAVTGTFFQATQPVSVADGSQVTLGAKADAKSTATDSTAITLMQVLKEISAMEQAPASRAVTNAGTFATQSAQSGTWTVQPGNTANSTPWLFNLNDGTNSLTAAMSAYGTAPTGTKVLGVNAFVTNVNANGQATMANSAPVVIASDQSAVHTVCDSGCSGSTAPADGSAFTESTTSFSPIGGYFRTSPTSLTTDHMGAVGMTNTRHLFVNIPDALPAGTNVIGHVIADSGSTTAVTGTVAVTQSGTWTVQPGNTANTTAWKVDGSAVTQPVSGTVTVTQATGTNLHTVCDSGCSSSVGFADNATFTTGTTAINPVGGLFDDTPPTAVATGKASAARITNNRALHINVRNQAGTEMGTSTNPFQVTLANTGANATAVKVDGSAATQPVSGTVTVNAGTNLNTSALALDATLTGGTQKTKIVDTGGTNVATVSAAGAVKVDGSAVTQPVSGIVTTTPPANASTNVAQVAGTTTDTNSGTKSAGTLRVVIATDQPQLTNKLLVTPDANSAVNVAQVNGATTSTAASGVQKVGIVGNAGATVDAASGATAATNSVLHGAAYNTTKPTPTSGQQVPVQTDAYSNVYVNPNPYPAVQLAQAVNNKVSAGAGTTLTNAFGSSTVAGNSILCIGFEGVAATPVFTDAQSNTYTVVISSGAAAPGYSVAIASNIVGGTTDTITLTTSSGSASFSCYELKGAVTVGQAWDYAAPAQATSASLVFPQQSAAIANDFVAVGVGMAAGTINATPSLAGAPSNLTTVDQSNTAPLGTAALAVYYSAHGNTSNSPTFTQALSLSASETYSAVLVAVKPVSISLVGNVQDPCQQGAGTSGNINLTAGGQLITGTAGKLTYICSMNFITATAQNIALVEGTGTVCATGIAGMAGGTTAATGWNFAANGGFVNGGGGFWVFKTATPGDNVCLLLSSTGQTSGSYRQVQQ